MSRLDPKNSECAIRPDEKKSLTRNATRSPRRACILILGMHRSGTSALARVVNLLGCDLPKTLMRAHHTNEAGFWESERISQFNERILESAGTTWDDWIAVNPGWLDSPKAEEFRKEALELLREEYGSSCFFVLKDPRICRLVPFWLDVLKKAGVRPFIVSPVRNPLEVTASLARRDNLESGLSHLLWLRHVLDAEFHSRGLPRFFTSYDRLLGGWARIATDAQAQLGISWPRMSEKVIGEIEDFLSNRHWHHQESVEAVLENPSLSHWTRGTFEVLASWAAAGEESRDFDMLDRTRAELNAAVPVFWRLTSAGKRAAEKLAEAEGELAQCRREAEEAAGALAASGEDLQRAAAAREGAEKAAAGLKEHVLLLRSDVKEGRQTIVEIAKQAKRVLAVLDISRNEMAIRLSEAQETCANQSAELQRHLDEVASLARQLHEARGEAANAAIAHSEQTAELEVRLKQQADDIDRLNRLVEESMVKLGATDLGPNRKGKRPLPELPAHLPGFLKRFSLTFYWRQFKRRRQATVLRRSGEFDAEWYLRQNTDVAKAGIDPLQHYIEFGAKEGRPPNAGLAHASGRPASGRLDCGTVSNQ